jgi:dTDP-4-dehydrorhamnose 3,5-epimerase
MTRLRPPSALPGVRYGAVARHADDRGAFRELWRASAFGTIAVEDAGASADGATGPTFVQANLSTSASGVLRGLHFHRRQLDYWTVASGRAFVALVDLRPMWRGRGAAPVVETRELVADEWVVIPSGVAHGFLALGPLELLYLVTNEYDGSDELGFAWDDPTAAVPWPPVPDTPDGHPILSDRDRSNPSLTELVVRLRHEP